MALAEGGALTIPGDPAVRGTEGSVPIRVERAHLEEDAGKSSHDQHPGASLVDLNRAGVPLVEVVGAPDLRSPQEASDYLKTLHRLVMALGICDGSLEEGSFRCDANVSLRRVGETAFGTRVEVKNLNSFRFVKQALAYEIERQGQLLAEGAVLRPETRGWDAQAGETRPQRSKEAATDYRYFPEPDLPPLRVAAAEITQARAALPELPEAKAQRWQRSFGLGVEEAQTLLQSPVFTAYFEALAEASGAPRAAAHWMLGEVSRTLGQGLEIGREDRALKQGLRFLHTQAEAALPALGLGLGQLGQGGPGPGLSRRPPPRRGGGSGSGGIPGSPWPPLCCAGPHPRPDPAPGFRAEKNSQAAPPQCPWRSIS